MNAARAPTRYREVVLTVSKLLMNFSRNQLLGALLLLALIWAVILFHV